MKKISLIIFFAAINIVAYAQNEEAASDFFRMLGLLVRSRWE